MRFLPYIILLIILSCSSLPKPEIGSYVFNQILPDSTISKYKIKKITQDWHGNPKHPEPYQTKIETYDPNGHIIHRNYINYSYHQYITHFNYHEKKSKVKVTQEELDWGPPKKENPKDTVTSTTHETFNLQKVRRSQQNGPMGYPSRIVRNEQGQIITQRDSIKCGYRSIHFYYDSTGTLVEKRFSTTRHHDPYELSMKILYLYNEQGQVSKELNLLNYRLTDDTLKHTRELEFQFLYNKKGLLQEKRKTTRYLSLGDDSTSSVYRYRYEYY